MITYRDGVPHGEYCDYWSNGQLAATGTFRDGKQDGVWCFYFDDGAPMESIQFADGIEIRRKSS
jgi:antitoxin component YwqK of YwqJK toxin-antitoxin module